LRQDLGIRESGCANEIQNDRYIGLALAMTSSLAIGTFDLAESLCRTWEDVC
jgi:hypothetical protein